MATKTKADLEREVAELKQLIETMNMKQVKGEESPKAPAAPMYVAAPSTDVEVIYTSHSMGHLEGKLFSLDASVYGESFTLSRGQFDELVGKYRAWFEDGRLAVSYKNIEVAASKGLPVDRDNGLTVKELHSLGSMSVEQIEKLWNKVKLESLHMSIVTYFKEKFLAGEPGYRDRARIDCLNRLTDGGFDSEATSVTGRQVKITPTDFVTATRD